jgi:hypothetical protein
LGRSAGDIPEHADSLWGEVLEIFRSMLTPLRGEVLEIFRSILTPFGEMC